MNVSVMCPSCREVLDIPGQYRGMDVRCAVCQAVIPIPHEPEPMAHRASPRMSAAHRRSNMVVWVLLLMTFFVSSGISLVLILFSHFMQNPPMQTVSDTNKKFNVQVVGQHIDTNQKGANGQILGIECNNINRNEKIWVKYYDIPVKDRKTDDQKLLESELDNEGQPLGAKIQQATDTYDTYSCVDRIYERGKFPFKQVTIVRAIRAGNRIYILAIQGQQGQVTPINKHVRHFFLSFEITGG